MRAKTINEAQNFERGKNPRATMDLGGIIYQEEFQNNFRELLMRFHIKLQEDLYLSI